MNFYLREKRLRKFSSDRKILRNNLQRNMNYSRKYGWVLQILVLKKRQRDNNYVTERFVSAERKKNTANY